MSRPSHTAQLDPLILKKFEYFHANTEDGSKRTTKIGIEFKSVVYDAMPSSSVLKTYCKDEVSYAVSFLDQKRAIDRVYATMVYESCGHAAV